MESPQLPTRRRRALSPPGVAANVDANVDAFPAEDTADNKATKVLDDAKVLGEDMDTRARSATGVLARLGLPDSLSTVRQTATTLAPRSFLCTRAHLRLKLFTREDPLNLHKTFGLLCLASFLYRYFWVFPRLTSGKSLGFVDGSVFDWATMLCHLALSSSSLIFHVLLRRNLARPFTIWNEYRLHAIVFTMRCVSVYAWAVLRPMQRLGFGPTAERLVQPMLVLAHHVLADEITRRYGPEDRTQTTVRCDGAKNAFTRVGMRIYAFYQFLALGSHLLPHDRLADLGFNTLIAIQSSAFLMTLFRKNLIRYYSHGIWYTACLLLSTYHVFLAHAGPGSLWFWARVLGAFLMRLRGNSKYLVWAGFVFVSLPQVETSIFTALQYVYEAFMAAGPVTAASTGTTVTAAAAAAAASVVAARDSLSNLNLQGVSDAIPSWRDVRSSMPDMPSMSMPNNLNLGGYGSNVAAWAGQKLPDWSIDLSTTLDVQRYVPSGGSVVLGTLVAIMAVVAVYPGVLDSAGRRWRQVRSLITM